MTTLPLFPLPNVVLFPGVYLPLHIFEPRYREMVADALASDRMIGMVLLRPGWERERGRGPASFDDNVQPPAVYPIGCNGVITHVERQADGCSNIVLRGLERFRILSEDHSRSYRRASIEPLTDRRLAPEDHAAIRRQRAKLETLLAPAAEKTGMEIKIPSAMSDEDLVNALAQYLDLEPLEKQALLEKPCLRTRAESLVELLEMKVLMARTPNVSHVAH